MSLSRASESSLKIDSQLPRVGAAEVGGSRVI